MRGYPEYKDSGVVWLGEIPSHWGSSKGKYIANFNMGQSPDGNDVNQEGKGRPFIQGNAEFGEVYPVEKNYCTEPTKICAKGDILISVRAPVGAMNIANKEFVIGRGLAAIAPKDGFDKHFAWYSLEIHKEQLSVMETGTTFKSISGDDLKNVVFSIPDMNEQNQIANYLDRETARIDKLITEKQNFIKLLKEKRQALISHVVTKGLDPDVKMKESGIEWIGEVPEHWGVGALGYYARLNTGATPDRKCEDYWGGDIPWIKTGEVRYNTIFDTEEKITPAGLNNSSVNLSPPGTVLMAMYGQGVTRGRVAVLGISATYNQACVAIQSSSKLVNYFLVYALMAAYHYIRNIGNETSQMNLNADLVRKIKIIAPPIEEQVEINKYLDIKLKKLNELEFETELSIEYLKEHRTALISAAVTGKIDVRDQARESAA